MPSCGENVNLQMLRVLHMTLKMELIRNSLISGESMIINEAVQWEQASHNVLHKIKAPRLIVLF